MPASDTRLVRVRTATRSGSGRTNEDRVFTTANSVVVLDGASHPDVTEHDGGWLAETLGSAIASRLTDVEPRRDLDIIVATSIAKMVRDYDLVPGQAPSTTVSIVRWQDVDVDAYVLGDSSIIALADSGDVLELRDNRLSGVAQEERRAMRRQGAFGNKDQKRWRRLVTAERRKRNRPNGYWIAEAMPEAAIHAYRKAWRMDKLTAIMVMTDGVSAGVDTYGVPVDWQSAFVLARDNPENLVQLIHEAENSDATGARWPRSKLHDDKTLAVVEFL